MKAIKGKVLVEYLAGLRSDTARIEGKLRDLDLASFPTMSPEYLMYAQDEAGRLLGEIERLERYAK